MANTQNQPYNACAKLPIICNPAPAWGEARKKLRITSKTTLQKLRDEGKIRFSQPEKKLILYEVESIYEYLGENANEPF
jgi:hypothetical protein